MNVFVLNSGRCGSTTFIAACAHITNYTAGHESRVTLLGSERLAYPPDHIEADNRLSWFLGRLEESYGDGAFYVHLTRPVEDTARSFEKRSGFGILRAYREGILMGTSDSPSAYDVALDYLHTVETNISLFLQGKTRTLRFRLENARDDFRSFWQAVGAEGDLAAALKEWDTTHNASD